MASAHHDIGLQPERTLLAWRRTLLSLMGVSALFLRWVPQHGVFAFGLIGLAMLAVTGIWLGQWQRYRVSTRGINDDRTPAPLREIVAMGLTCVALGGLGLYVVVRF